MYAPLHHRRAALIQERLPHVSAKPIVFPAKAPTAPLGSWTLLAPDRAAGGGACSSPFRQRRGGLRRGQGRPAQPRLSEALGGAGAARPLAQAGRALPRSRRLAGRLDLGAGQARRRGDRRRQGAARSQGGGDARRDWRGESAFALEPASVGAVDWLFSDIACYPARLLRLVETWRSSGLVRNFVCTIKFQGETDHDAAAAFAAIPGAQVLHLHHNKHELTFSAIGVRPWLIEAGLLCAPRARSSRAAGTPRRGRGSRR